MNDGDLTKPLDVSGPNLEEAIESGLRKLGLSRNDVIIEIIEEGSRGMLGLGARDAKVRLTPLRSPAPAAKPAAAAPAPRQQNAPVKSQAQQAVSQPAVQEEIDDDEARLARDVL